MRQLPINPLSPEQQQKIIGQMHRILARQVQSYHKFHHMGSSSSVPMELARDLAESVEYTLHLAGGIYACEDLEKAIAVGQALLHKRLGEAEALLDLVNATAPRWQTECRWEALRYLESFLTHYDYRHLAHIGPEGLFYPILIAPPEELRGIDSCIFYLKILWIENRIMAGFPEEVLEAFWDRLPAGTLNQCEQLLLNGLGKAVLGAALDSPLFSPEEYYEIRAELAVNPQRKLRSAALRLCGWLNLADEDAQMYVQAGASQLALWSGGADVSAVFV